MGGGVYTKECLDCLEQLKILKQLKRKLKLLNKRGNNE
tara:strand:+ start:993 stop:1106 length:114 start_codon:yes stop_codon:yes gene_type:complete